MKILIITANIGGFDTPKNFIEQSLKCDFISITENNLPRPMTTLDDRMKAKYFKLQTHKLYPDYDAYIWMDSAFQIKSEGFANRMIAELVNHDIAVTKHPDRNCIYTEAEFVLQGIIKGSNYLIPRYSKSKINVERNYYESLLYPKDNGLYACGLFARWNNEKLNSFFDKWWNSCLMWSAFDQLSFPVLAQQNNIRINGIAFDKYTDNQFYQIIKHTKRA